MAGFLSYKENNMRYFSILMIALFLCSTMFISCRSSEEQVDIQQLAITELPYKSNLLPGIHDADSAYILYYHKAGDHRFYSTTRVTDKKSLEPLMQAANETIIPNANDCITQGKIHFYATGGKVYTLYFSSADSCNTLSFIHTGEKYFTHLPKAISAWLYQQRDHAIE